MEFNGVTSNFPGSNAEALAVVLFKGEKAGAAGIKELDALTGGQIAAAIKDGEIKGASGETALFRLKTGGGTKASRLLVIGCGDKDKFKASDVAVAAGTATRYVRKLNLTSLAFSPRYEGDAVEIAQNAAQGCVTSQFELDKYKTADKETKEVKKFLVHVEGAKGADLKKGISRGQIIGESMNFTRDLANEPPNILTPTEMANRAAKIAKETGLKFEALDEAKMKRLGMGSLLSVSAGSEQPAKLIILKYTPAKSTAKKGELLALVGKGITFDTGGISLKPGENMDAMKYDMSGGATVLGTMRAIALLKPSVPVLGIVAAVENMPDGKATRPSDVVTAMNGKTVEILNTDAEGRLVLADAVAYAEKQGATRIIDMATLTGAVIIALGEHNTGIMGNDQAQLDDVIACGKEVGENFWQLPLSEEYSKQIRSDIADIKNIGPRMKAGTIMGAAFIQEFIDKAKWTHLDIAGTAWNDSAKPHQSKGPTAVAVRTLVKYVERSQ
ncbi:MAG: leucyl aminopeptidase [Acidobacteria bacterium]|nr:leucyl aminopeptidase [Acidobacteriota bacterium]